MGCVHPDSTRPEIRPWGGMGHRHLFGSLGIVWAISTLKESFGMRLIVAGVVAAVGAMMIVWLLEQIRNREAPPDAVVAQSAAPDAKQSVTIEGSGNTVNQGGDVNIGTYINNPPQRQPGARGQPQSQDGELVRRRILLEKLRNLWIASNDGISSEMLAGLEWPPKEWLNQKLGEMGESGRVSRTSGDRIWTNEIAIGDRNATILLSCICAPEYE